MSAKIKLDKCTKCGVCVDHCPEDIIAISKGDFPKIQYPDECWYCGACIIDCKTKAIYLELPLFLRFIPEPYETSELKVIKEY